MRKIHYLLFFTLLFCSSCSTEEQYLRDNFVGFNINNAIYTYGNPIKVKKTAPNVTLVTLGDVFGTRSQ